MVTETRRVRKAKEAARKEATRPMPPKEQHATPRHLRPNTTTFDPNQHRLLPPPLGPPVQPYHSIPPVFITTRQPTNAAVARMPRQQQQGARQRVSQVPARVAEAIPTRAPAPARPVQNRPAMPLARPIQHRPNIRARIIRLWRTNRDWIIFLCLALPALLLSHASTPHALGILRAYGIPIPIKAHSLLNSAIFLIIVYAFWLLEMAVLWAFGTVGMVARGLRRAREAVRYNLWTTHSRADRAVMRMMRERAREQRRRCWRRFWELEVRIRWRVGCRA